MAEVGVVSFDIDNFNDAGCRSTPIRRGAAHMPACLLRTRLNLDAGDPQVCKLEDSFCPREEGFVRTAPRGRRLSPQPPKMWTWRNRFAEFVPINQILTDPKRRFAELGMAECGRYAKNR